MKFCDQIAEISLKTFSSLPKTGKPNDKEWTVMSTIVKYDENKNDFDVLSLGTGSKCIGANSMSQNGDILNDSHAEIICRRSFIKYMFKEIESYLQTAKSNIFYHQDFDKKIKIRENISFHLFSTHMPCGDASIFPKNNQDDFGICVSKVNEDQKNTSTEDSSPAKKIKVESDIYRTGAKCLKENLKQDPKISGNDYHILGVVRTKPGRGDPTLSVSCSDKLAKWFLLGIQGSLLFKLLKEPIYLTSITISGGTPFSEEALKRAICNRIKTNILVSPFKHEPLKLMQSKLYFSYCKSDSKQPCPSSIIWYKNCKKIEVSVEGKKQGVTKKNKNTKTGRLSICKNIFYSDFTNIVEKYPNVFNINLKNYNCYLDLKNDVNCQYLNFWERLKLDVFKVWPCKDKNLLLFRCSD